MKKVGKFLREYANKIINFKKKKMKLLIKEQHKSYEDAKICYTWKKEIKDKHAKNKQYYKFSDHCHYKEKIEVLHIECT